MMTPNLPHLSTKILWHLDSNAPYLMPLSPISMIYLTSTQQPAPRHFHTAPLLTSLPLKSFNSPRSQNIKWRTTGSKMPSHLSNFHQKTWLTSFPLNSLTQPPSTWHPVNVIIIIITVPDQWITDEPQGTINSNHLNRKLQLQCCGDGSNNQHIWNVVRRSLQPWFVHCAQL